MKNLSDIELDKMIDQFIQDMENSNESKINRN